MNLPRFSAEASLYRAHDYGIVQACRAGIGGYLLRPQMLSGPGGPPRICLPHCFGPCQPDIDPFQGGWQSCIDVGCNLYSAPCKPCCSVESDCINCDGCDTNPARDCPPGYYNFVCHRCRALKIQGKCNPKC